MHVWISPNLVDYFGNDLIEGHTYEIQNFLVTTYTQKYKCFASETHILFTHLTTVTVFRAFVSDHSPEIFDFTYLGNINQALFQDNYCIGKFSYPFNTNYIFNNHNF